LGAAVCIDKKTRAGSNHKRVDMAAEGDVKELTTHRVGYDRFVSLMRRSAAACVIIALIVILLIAD
jgi:hypothetical protein